MSFYPNQLQTFFLAGAGVVAGDTTLTLKSMTDIDGNSLTMATAFGAVGFGTIEPGNQNLEEQISFTGLVNNANGTVTLTGVKSVSFGQPYTETSGFSKSHAGSTQFVISNTSGYYSEFAIKQNNEDITGYWDVPNPIDSTNIANKAYVDATVNGGPVSQDSVIITATAGETISAGQIVYLKTSDGLWYKASSAASATTDFIKLGIAQGAGTVSSAITGGVLIEGVDSNQSGLVAGTIYYLSTGGAISASAGATSRAIGQAKTATSILFDPYFQNSPSADQKAAMAGTLGTPSSTNKFVTQSDTTLLTPAGSILSYGGRSAPTGWLLCDGTAVSRTTYASLFAAIAPAQTFTVTVASPAVFTATNHGLVAGDKISLTTTGALPTGLASNTDYYVISTGLTTSAFQVSTSRGGAAVNTSGTQSGTHTLYASNYGKGDGSTTFNLPDFRGYTPYGYKSSDANFDVLNVPNTYVGEKTHVLTVGELATHSHTYTKQNGSGGSNAGFSADLGNAAPITGQSQNIDSAGSNTAHNNMPPYVVTNFIIKT